MLSAVIDGKGITSAEPDQPSAPPAPLRLSFYAPPAEGVELTLELRAARPLKLALRDVSYELPAINGQPAAPRPPDTMPPPSSLAGETTVVSKAFSF